jgi:glutamate dehydrogenase
MASGRFAIASDLVERIVALARSRSEGTRAEQIELFVRHYYRRVPLDDLEGRSVEDLYFSALGLLNFMRQREPGTDKLRVYAPDLDADGWSSPHTVIDLVTEDRPFLVDSLAAELSLRDMTMHLVVHPVFFVHRGEGGALTELYARGQVPQDALAESIIRIEIDRQAEPDGVGVLVERLATILRDGRLVVEDWKPMLEALEATIHELEASAPPPRTELDETLAFLLWLADNNFTFLGYRRYDLTAGKHGSRLKTVPESALGIFRGAPPEAKLKEPALGRPVPPEVMRRLTDSSLLLVTKSARRATVHRPTQMDSVEVKRYDAKGKVTGVHRFLGLYTSAAYSQPPTRIPLLRQKVAIAVARAGFSAGGHDGKALLNILATYPRDELFQVDDDELLETSLGILHLEERPRLRLFTRRDSFEWSVSCLVFVPRDRYDSKLRRQITEILEESFDGSCQEFFTTLGNAPLARLHVIIKTTPGAIPDIATETVEAHLVAALRGWHDNLHDALLAAHDEHRAAMLERRYAAAFPPGYRDRFSARAAVLDIGRLEEAVAGDGLALNLYRPPEAPEGAMRFKIYHCGGPLALSDVLPMLENMGLRVIDEFPYRLAAGDGAPEVWIYDFGVVDRAGLEIDVAETKQRFQEAFERIWRGEVENDGFNQLITRAGLGWRQVTVLRAYCKFLRQAKIPFSQAYVESTLASNPLFARLLVRLFEERFDPALTRRRDEGVIVDEIVSALDTVASLDQDRIIHRFLNAVRSTLRTNYFQTGSGGAPHPHLSFKVDSGAIDELPLPRPWVEIFVYSARMEGVHLRGGKVARGGLRWSDRPEDFRTEVLGLMKAQMAKNAVIVPVGAKGGFVVKRPPAGGRDAVLGEGVECYKTLVRGMLDLTDNLVGARVVPPEGVVRYDDDDPYLVVAADKGTATFSDIANGVAEDYGFWLGDAFASGGSAGYDHKKMGITARGAWESVKRHFREIGIDAQSEPFTVAGIGDMAGDVFGNGMLLSRRIKLVAAFNHLHIFLDPDPDPEASFEERKRLFEMPRSSWKDYDRKLISADGGVFERSAKSVTLSAAMRRLLAVRNDKMTPNELISAILRAPVDLLWNGGIGTFVKASGESDAEVGDRANDAVRIDAAELRCKVIGEGGNLGLTQRARIEAARLGVRLNTDAIDNSAGVDCSDHEVNIKVLLGDVEAAGELTRKQRDKLLVQMTDAVAERCLADNYLQTLGIGVIESLGAERLDLQQRMMQMLERQGRLDRAVEFLPGDEAIEEMRNAGVGLSRPEISVLYAYAKIALYGELLESDLPDDPYLASELELYFPKPLVKKLGKYIRRHRLRREIIATRLSNSMVNRASMVFALMAQEQTGRGASDVARAYVVARDAFGLRELWAAIEALDNKVPARVQNEMIVALRRLIEHSTLWFLRNRPQPLDCGAAVELFGAGIAALVGVLGEVLPPDRVGLVAEAKAALEAHGVPGAVAETIASVEPLFSACNIVDAANRCGLEVRDAARLYFLLGRRLGLEWLRARARQLASTSHWQHQAVSALVDDLYGQQMALTMRVVNGAGTDAEAVERWAGENKVLLARNARLLADLRAQPGFDLAMLAVANRQMRDLITA